jgi:glycosyltransferase involved in cell wall biosynthesis
LSGHRVVMLLSNAFRPDPRVDREAQALARHGYAVTVVCWDRRAELPEHEIHHGVEIIRVHGVPSAYGSGTRQLFYLPRFWRAAAAIAAQLRPDVVHCHDLDTLAAGWLLKRRWGTLLVYDAHEHYPALMSLYLPAPMVAALAAWERRLQRRVDATITASSVLADEFRARGVDPVTTVGNFQDLSPFMAVEPAQVAAARAQLGASPAEMVVSYIGGFSRNRMLLPLVKAAALQPDVQFHLWGDGAQQAEIAEATARQPNAHYHGWLAPQDLPRFFGAADAIFYCLRLDYPGAIYNAPNTLSNAMAAGRPIIANDVGDLGRIVAAAGCGILIDEATPEAIAAAVDILRDPAVRQHLGANGLRAAQTTYNAAVLEQELVDLYHTFT